MCNSISTFVKNNQTLCVLTGGISIIGFLAWRLVIWLSSLCGTVKKTDQIARKKIASVDSTEEASIPARSLTLAVTPLLQSPPHLSLMPKVILDLTAQFLTLSEFAILSCVSKNLAKIKVENYLRSDRSQIETLFHRKIDLSESVKWREGVLHAASKVSQFTIKDPDLLTRFTLVKSSFSRLNTLIVDRHIYLTQGVEGREPSSLISLTLPSLLLPTVTNLELPYDHDRVSANPTFTNSSLQKLTLNEIPFYWWRYGGGPFFPALRVLTIRKLENVDAVSAIKVLTTLEELNLRFRGFDPVPLRGLTQELTNLRSLSLDSSSGGMRFFSDQEINEISAFRELKKLFLGPIEVTNETSAALDQLSHIESLELKIRLIAPNNAIELKSRYALFDKMANLSNLTNLSLSFSGTRFKNSNSDRYRNFVREIIEKIGSKIKKIKYDGSELIDSILINEKLNLENCQYLIIFNAIIDCNRLKRFLQMMPKLQYIYIGGSCFEVSNNEGVEKENAKELHLGLQQFKLNSNTFSAEAMEEFARWNIRSERMQLSETRKGRGYPDPLLVGLVVARKRALAESNPFTDQDLIHLMDKIRVDRLTLLGGIFTDLSLLHLSTHHQRLRSFIICQDDETRITEVGIKAICSLRSLEEYYFTSHCMKKSKVLDYLSKRLIHKNLSVYATYAAFRAIRAPGWGG